MTHPKADPRRRVFTGAPWEEKVGYCRALRTGNQVFVTGTVAIDASGQLVGIDDAYAQTTRCLDIIEGALGELGATLRHVVRTKLYVTDISRWEDIGRAHGERFGDHPPCTTMVEVAGLMEPEMLIEVEADAVVD